MASWLRRARVSVGCLTILAGCHPETPADAELAPPPASRAAGLPAPSGATRGPPPPPASAPPPAGEAPPPSEEPPVPAGRRPLAVLSGQASYYGDSLAGHRTASGERYDPRAFTAAHRTLPFGTVLRVVRKDGKGSVVVRVTDRGPFGRARRILDLSRAAAERLQMIRAGVVEVRVEVLEYGKRRRR